jgi:hypothetical protein
LDYQVWNSRRYPDAFICSQSGAQSFLVTHQFHWSGFDDFLHHNTGAVLVTRCPINPAPNAYGPRDSRIDHIAICFIKKHVVPNAETGLLTDLTITSRG